MDQRKMVGGDSLKTIPVFVDNFTIAKAAPLGSPLACDGLGQWTVTDTENKLSISDGKLNFAPKAVPSFTDPMLRLGVQTSKKTGTCITLGNVVKDNSKIIYFGFSNMMDVPTMMAVSKPNSADIYNIIVRNSIPFSSAFLNPIILMTENRYFFFGKVSGVWKIIYTTADATATIYTTLSTYNSTGTIEKVAAYILPAPFNTDYGLATYRLAGAIPDGTTFAHNPNACIGVTATTLSAAQVVKFRIQDANNYWAVNIAADGSFTLSEVVAGTPTTRGTAAASSIANGQRLGIIADGINIRVLANDVSKIYYTSATNFQTATSGSVSIGTGAISDLACWPVEITGRAAKILDKVTR